LKAYNPPYYLQTVENSNTFYFNSNDGCKIVSGLSNFGYPTVPVVPDAITYT